MIPHVAISADCTGENFSSGATYDCEEKIVESAAIVPSTIPIELGGVALISKSDQTCHAFEKTEVSGFLWDLDNLTLTQLRAKYAAEANSHRNMKSRSKKGAATVHPAFQEFLSFLRLVGPMPVKGATLDRIDNNDREYAPGKVRWADKRTQNNNKGDTLTFHHPRSGEVFTTTRLAKLQGKSPSAIRARLGRGWSDAEIIAGYRFTKPPAPSPALLKPQPSSTTLPPRSDAIASVPIRSRTAREIQFERMAEQIEYERQFDDEEPLPALWHVINEDLPEAMHITEKQGLRRFASLWPEYRPHMNFEHIGPDHMRALEIVDPEYVRREREKVERQAKMTSQL